MDLSRKTIQNLTQCLDEKREELTVFYRQFGEKLYNDSTDPAIATGALSAERITSWRSQMAERITETKSLLDIKDALTRQQELVHFKKELSVNLQEENALYRNLLEELGRAFYSQYTERDAAIFGDTYEKASVEGNILIQLEGKQDTLQHQLAESGFFGKLFAQFKMAGLASNLRQQKSRVMRILADGASSMVTSGALEQQISDGSLDSDFTKVYFDIKDAIIRLEELKKRGNTLETDFAAIATILENGNASANPLRRMDELRHHIKETDKRIDSLTILSSREYSDKFLDENGVSLLGNTGDGHTFSDMGSYAHQLEQIALLRSDISVICRKIEVLETSFKIESLTKQISQYERSITDYERKILHYQEMSESLRKNIRESTDEKLRLHSYKETIENTLR